MFTPPPPPYLGHGVVVVEVAVVVEAMVVVDLVFV